MTNDHHENRQLDEILDHSYRLLREEVPGQRDAVVNEFVKLGACDRRPNRTRPLRAVLLALTACFLLAATLRLLIVASSPSVAYGLESLPRRLLDVQTIRVRGARFVYDMRQPDAAPIKVPFEYLLRRPNKFSITWTGTSQGRGPVEIQRGSRICDGRSVSVTNDTKKQFSTGPILSALSARVETEAFAQMFILTAMLGPPETPFRKIGEEKLNGQWCELYEGQVEDSARITIEKLWFDPTRGHPVRIVRDEVQDDGTARRKEEIDEIAVNVPLADELFQLTPPEDYQPMPRTAETADRKLALSPEPRASSSAMGTKLEAWYSWQLNDRAALVVWRRSPPPAAADDTPDWLSNLDIKPAEPKDRQSARHAWTHQSGKSDEWNWSVVVAAGGAPPQRVAFILELHDTRGNTTSQYVHALHFPDSELEDILVESGRSTLPSDVAVLSLAELRARADQLVRFDDEK